MGILSFSPPPSMRGLQATHRHAEHRAFGATKCSTHTLLFLISRLGTAPFQKTGSATASGPAEISILNLKSIPPFCHVKKGSKLDVANDVQHHVVGHFQNRVSRDVYSLRRALLK